MGVYEYIDPQTGQGYNFTIAGDAPSNTEFAQIRQILDQDRAGFAAEFEETFDETPEDEREGVVRESLRRGYQNIKQAVGETVGTIGEQSGLGFLAQYGQDTEEKARQRLGELSLEQRQRLESTDVQDFSTGLQYAGQLVGEQLPQLGLGLGAAVAAPFVGATGFLGGVAAAGIATAPVLFGNNIQRQEDEVAQGKKASVDVGDALLATFGQATLEGISDKILLGGAFRTIGKSIFTRTASRATGGVTTEGLTEVGQQMMERAQAGLPIDSDDAIAEYREAAIAGGLIGGGTRATLGAFQGDVEAPTPTEVTPPPTQEVEVAPEADIEADIETAVEEAVEEQVNRALATDARLTDPNLDEDFIREELDQEYSPEVIEAIIAQKRLVANAALETDARNAVDPTPPPGAAEQTQEQRDTAAAATIAETATPPVALATEEANAVNAKSRINEKLKEKAALKTQEYLTETTQESGTAAIESEQTGEQIEVKASEAVAAPQEQVIDDDFLANLNVPKQALIRREGTKKSLIGKKVSDEGVLDELRNYAKISSIPEAKEGVQGFLDTLEVEDAGTRLESEGVGTGIPSGQPSVVGGRGRDGGVGDTAPLAAPDARPVGTDLLDTDGVDDTAGTQPDTLEPEVTPDERGIEAVQQLAEQATATPVQVAPQPTPQPAVQAPATPAMQQAAIGGAETGAAAQQIPAPVQVPPAPEMQAAPVPQEQLQAADAQRDVVAQTRIDRVFESNRGKQPQVREYHDTQVDPRSAPEVTTAVDKEGVAELLETSDKELNPQAKAAKLFFKRFRRPVDALAEMGAVSAIGPTQSVEKDYKPAEFAFYKGMTQKAAMDARKWVFDNLSRQAFVETRDASVRARRDTAKYNPSDAYIAVTKAAKSIQRKENKAFEKQMDRELDALKLEAQTRPPAELDQEMRAEGAVGATEPIKGQTAFDSYLIGMGYKKRKVPKQDDYVFIDPDTKKALTDEELMDFYDGFAYTQNELGFLLVDPVHGLDQTLLPSIRNALQRGDLQFTLDAIASTSQVDRIREIAAKLGNIVGDTQVQVVDDLSQVVGRTAAGLFSPETNTILIDANNGMNVHTILHEMTHAATSASLANPSLPEVKQLQAILKNMREQLGEVYGTANLDEFVAEAFSNPEFQRALALAPVDGGKMSGWEKFTGAVKRIVRKLLGLSPSPTALSEVDRIIEGLLTPSPATRAAPDMLLLGRTKEGATNLFRNHIQMVPVENKNIYEATRDIVNTNTPRTLRKFVLGVQPVNNLVRLAKDKIPFAGELNVLIDQASGALRSAFEPVDVIYNDYRAYKKANPEGYKKLFSLMNRATQDEVDPARPRDTYTKYWMSYYDNNTEKTVMRSFDTDQDRAAEIARLNAEENTSRTKAKKAGDPSEEKTAIWDVLNKEYKALGKQGQDIYNITRDMGEAAQDRIMPAIKERISSLGVDAETQKTAFEKLSELLHAQGGIIRPYFKLGRDGDFRLQYNAPDPLRGGGIEVFTEYYTTEKDLRQAQQNVVKYLTDNGQPELIGAIESGKRDAQRNYGKAPSSSFVFEILQTLQLANVDQDSIDRIIDLSLDAIPERSFMQSFRSRKERESGGRGVLGAIGDITPSGMPGVEADPAERFRDNFRSIEKQLVQLEYGAKIQGFRNKLKEGGYFQRIDTEVMAEKLDQIATFAQAPSMARWSRIATSLGFGWTMGANVSSALNVMFDIPMAVYPQLAGEYGGGKAMSAISKATKLFMGSPKTKMITVMGADGQPVTREVELGMHNKGFDNYNFDDPNLDPEIKKYKALIDKAGARGMFNQSIDQEHVDLTDARDALAKANQISGFLVHHGERFGRQITLMSAYDLELQKLSNNGKKRLTDADYEAAADKAIDTTELTLGSTASAGRPVWAQNPVGNVVFLFKRFAVSRYYYMAHLLDQALAGASPETRKIARNQLAYFMTVTGLLAGVSGLPMMGAIGAIYDLFADENEDDFEAMMRKNLGGTMYTGIANELLGIDVASRVSMNSLLYRQPFIDKDQSALWTLTEQLGGPVLGVLLSAERGKDLWIEGEVRRGLEAMAPAAIRNLSKMERFSREGANTLRGNPIVDDISPYNAFMQGIGFAPADYVENLKINQSERRRKNAIDTKRRKLMRLHNMARQENDREALSAALRKIKEFNASLPPQFRVESRIDSADLKKSYAGFKRTTGNMINGIVYTDAMRKSVQEYQ